jgi:5-oxoprolinase (ATP-hydrolysing)
MVSFRWQFWVDRGGTFTDCIGVRTDTGEIRVAKVLSSDWAPLKGIRKLLDLRDDDPIPPCEVRMGTTVATNALLERNGVPTVLLTTHGFEDILRIGTQSRPDLFSLEIQLPSPLYTAAFGLPMRQDLDGRVLERPSDADIDDALRRARHRGAFSVAVLGLNAYVDGVLEHRVAERARQLGFRHVSCSSAVSPEVGMVARGDTTVVDAYCTPLLQDYLDRLSAALAGSELRLMQSSGGLSRHLRGKDAVLSGPAGGVVAVGALADRLGVRAIGFDMGGTSTDVSRWDGHAERQFETEVAGVRLRAPMMAIHTVAAGGGSVCRFDGARFSVGPDSAGSDPGPLCYGHPDATELTLTDVNLVLGRVCADRFPLPLDGERARAALASLDAGDPEAAAEGFFRVAVAVMADAIRQVTVAKGHDVRDHALVVFGGAGGQVACALARQLGIRHVVVHPLAGVFSALGMGLAPLRWDGSRDAQDASVEEADALEPLFAELDREGRQRFPERQEQLRPLRSADLRYRGTEHTLNLPWGPDLRARFDRAHERRFGYGRPHHPVEVAAVRLALELPPPDWSLRPEETTKPLRRSGRLVLDGRAQPVPVMDRGSLHAPTVGPVVIVDDTGTVVVEPDFTAEVDTDGVLHLHRTAEGSAPVRSDVPEEADPVQLEIMAHAFMSVAEEMGAVLRNTAVSTNIRERRDFSCAVFDPAGRLVANAPHIPVHLGAMGETVKAILAAHPDLEPGDVFLSNDPDAGGSHLPDVTVVTPVFREERLAFVVASRGHHADIGGVTPGSMPPFSRRLEEEGVVFRNEVAVRAGVLRREALRQRLTSGPHPARAPDDNLADFEAQIAANRTGARRMQELSDWVGLEVVQRYMDFVRSDAARQVRRAVAELPDGARSFEDRLDDGTPIRVRIDIRGSELDIDFAGSGAPHAGNLNAPPAVTVAAVLYVLRCLVGRPIPLNGGCLEPVTLRIPRPSLLHPPPGHAVAGGNVETSQRVVDVLLGAFDRAAASQGTMNNVTFGREDFGYYETIGGGAGATPHGPGASGVHTHMTNTRITDPEVLERHTPIRLVRFGLRRGSGGDGHHAGGDGLERVFEVREPLRASLLTERRATVPFGLAGGRPGLPGEDRLNGVRIPGRGTVELRPGDRLELFTPGGGGYGKPRN